MNTKHTQGPWHTGIGNGEGSIFSDAGRTRLEDGGTTLYPIARIASGWNADEDAANARLIAAAPDLLAALREIVAAASVGQLDEYSTSGDWFREARAAIQQATGEA